MARNLLNLCSRLASSLKIQQFLAPQSILQQSARTSTNFFNKLPAEALWKGVTSVSNAGRKRGRGKAVGRKLMKDLNRGQVIGIGKANIAWPGLSAPIMRGKELVEQHKLPEDPERQARLIKLRDEMGALRFAKLSPLDRGWSGGRMPGRSIGPPDAIGENTFEGFDTKVLEFKMVFNMKGNFGRTRRLSVMCVTGNGNGLAGFSVTKSVDAKAAMRKAKNRAGQKLMHVERFEGRTIYHDFFTQFGKTKIIVSQKPAGHGLVCHRAIKTICEVVGIRDLHARVEGSTNLQHVVKAFFLGLLKQRTHQQIADEKRLHLVEMCKENHFYPRLLASPAAAACRTRAQIQADEVLDFSQYCLDNRIVLKRKKFPPFYAKHYSYELYLKKQEYLRNQDAVRINLMAEYGEVRSFLADKYPECRPYRRPPKEAEAEAEAEAEGEDGANNS